MPQHSKMIIKDVRCVYTTVQSPWERGDGKPGKYSLRILIPKSDKGTIKTIRSHVKSVLIAEFGSKCLENIGNYKSPLRDGDTDENVQDKGPIYKGMYFMNIRSYDKPGVVNRFNEIATEKELEEHCYPGAYVHVSAGFFPFNHSGLKGVGAGLNNIMLRMRGDRLNREAATDAFGNYADETEEFDEFDDVKYVDEMVPF